jgi:hypothetical protein
MGQAHLVWIDPGQTTGLAVASIRPSWLAGRGDPGFVGLGKAITTRWVAQVGREPRIWSGDRARRPRGRHVIEGATSLSLRRARAGAAEMTTVLAELLDGCSEAEALLLQWPEAAWGIESFNLYPGAKSGEVLSPLWVYGALAFAELQYGERARVPFMQSSSYAKTTVDDARLRAARCYFPGMRHANDAMRHVLTFFRDARAHESVRALAWPKLFKPKGDDDDLFE